MSESPYISVIIASYKRPGYLVECVESLLRNKYDSFEILIIWQADDTPTRDEIVRHFGNEKKVKLFHAETAGVSNARNLGVERSEGEILAFIDDDALAVDTWLQSYEEIFRKTDPCPGVAGGKVIPQWEGDRPAWYPEEREFLLGVYDKGDAIMEFPENDIPFLANLAMPKDVFLEVGGIDARLGFNASRKSISSGADSLLALRAKDAGYKIYYHPRAQIFHRIITAKMSKKFFLKRHYWEGRSYLKMQFYRGNIKRDRLFRVIFLHLGGILKNGVLFMKAFLAGKDGQSRRMLYLARVTLSAGTCVEAGSLLLSGNQGKEGAAG